MNLHRTLRRPATRRVVAAAAATLLLGSTLAACSFEPASSAVPTSTSTATPSPSSTADPAAAAPDHVVVTPDNPYYPRTAR